MLVFRRLKSVYFQKSINIFRDRLKILSTQKDPAKIILLSLLTIFLEILLGLLDLSSALALDIWASENMIELIFSL